MFFFAVLFAHADVRVFALSVHRLGGERWMRTIDSHFFLLWSCETLLWFWRLHFILFPFFMSFTLWPGFLPKSVCSDEVLGLMGLCVCVLWVYVCAVVCYLIRWHHSCCGWRERQCIYIVPGERWKAIPGLKQPSLLKTHGRYCNIRHTKKCLEKI